jgi:ABC-type multidrug transport system permease subunit
MIVSCGITQGATMFIINPKGSITHFFGGTFILASIILSFVIDQRFLVLTAFLGMSMVISSLTGFSLLERILVSIGIKKRTIKE